ncbi:hypothetical protein F383_32070 [Gossypium arboreum]|uniref:Uncharacterized protein n=1 Tax=Gossypium arboreum TaxID=29729 RepID=A0A0B0N080_GOSAR|nr:hypothetical protein F383_32070 [Gossypium arboreum]
MVKLDFVSLSSSGADRKCH